MWSVDEGECGDAGGVAEAERRVVQEQGQEDRPCREGSSYSQSLYQRAVDDIHTYSSLIVICPTDDGYSGGYRIFHRPVASLLITGGGVVFLRFRTFLRV